MSSSQAALAATGPPGNSQQTMPLKRQLILANRPCSFKEIAPPFCRAQPGNLSQLCGK
jgi:hypothetical protein